MKDDKRKNTLTSDGTFWPSDTITIEASDLIGTYVVDPYHPPGSIFSDDYAAPLKILDPETECEFDVLHELKETRDKLEAMETLIDALLDRAKMDTSVAEALEKHEMIRRLSE